MFRIADGREYFYQWDLDRQVIVEDPSIVEVHFCNRTDECSLVVDVVNGLANVPNLILQKSFDVRVFGYDGKATRYDKVFKVKPRTKPADYVYTETEIKNYDELKERVDEIEKNGVSQEAINTAVGKYLEENPLGDIPTKVSQLENDSNFITREEVPETDLSEYAKKSEIPDVSDFITSIPGEYITENELKAKGFTTEAQVDNKVAANRVWVNTQNFATQSYVDDAIANIDIPEGADLSEYAKKSDIPTDYLKAIPDEYITEEELNNKGYLTEHQSLDGYATEQYVNDAIANIDIPEGSGSASIYELVLPAAGEIITDTKTVELLDNALLNDVVPLCSYQGKLITDFRKSGQNVYLTCIKQPVLPAGSFIEYDLTLVHLGNGSWKFNNVTETSRKYVSKTSQLENDSDFTTKAYVDEAISGIEIPEGGCFPYNRGEVVEVKVYGAESDISKLKQTLSEIPSGGKAASKDYVDNAIANSGGGGGGGSGGSADLTNYYTKEETNELLRNINECDTYFFNPYEVEWQSGLTPTIPSAHMIEFAQRFLAGDAVNLYIANKASEAVEAIWLNAIVTRAANEQVQFRRDITRSDFTSDGSEHNVQVYSIFEYNGTWRITKPMSYSYSFVNKTYVDNAIQTALNGIATAEGGAY